MLAGLLVALAPVSTLDGILDDPALKGAVVAAIVRDSEGKVLFSRNSETRVMPASNQKLLSTTFAMATLGPSFRPQTAIWRRGDTVFIRSNGDPTVTADQLAATARKVLAGQRAKRVVVSEAYRPGVPPSWELDDLPNKYAARIAALCFDRGAFTLKAEGGRVRAPRPEIGVDIELRPWSKSESRVEYDPFTRQIVVNGKIPSGLVDLDTLAQPEPDAAAARFFAPQVVFGGSLTPPAGATMLQGPALTEIIRECLHVSDNIYAENLLLMAGGPYADPTKPYPQAGRALAKFLKEKVGIADGLLLPEDGSGMSRHNLVTAKGISDLLLWVRKQPWLGAYESALAASDEPGTLKQRLSGVPFRGKTGTLDKVSALSGYVRSASGKTLVVSLIFNHAACSVGEQHRVQDAFIRALSADTTIGTAGAGTAVYGSSSWPAAISQLGTGVTHEHWPHRSAQHGGASRSGSDRRAQSAHATLHRNERMALCLR